MLDVACAVGLWRRDTLCTERGAYWSTHVACALSLRVLSQWRTHHANGTHGSSKQGARAGKPFDTGVSRTGCMALSWRRVAIAKGSITACVSPKWDVSSWTRKSREEYTALANCAT